MNRKMGRVRFHNILIFTLFAGVLFCSCGGGGGAGSGSSVANPEMSTILKSGASYYENIISTGIGKDMAIDNTVNWFKKQKGVSEAYPSSDHRNIFLKENNGLTTLFVTDSSIDTSLSLLNNASNKKLVRETPLKLLSQSQNIKAIVIDMLNKATIHNSSLVYNVLNTYPGAEIVYTKGPSVIPEIFQNLSRYDLIYYIGHGGIDERNGNIVFISTGASYYDINNYASKYNDDKNNYRYFGRVFIVEESMEYLGINSNFIADYSKGLNATAVYIDACNSLRLDKNDTMAQAFMNNGAKSYLGWDEKVIVSTTYANWLVFNRTDEVAESFFESVLACNSVSSAFNSLPYDYNKDVNLHYRGDGKLPICDPTSPILPEVISVSPSSGSWTSSPQNLSISSSNSTIIYYTMVNTSDGNIPEDPREPTSSDNDGSVPVSGGAGTFQLYATTGQNKQSKLRFKGYNSAGAGPASVVYSYTINLISGTTPHAFANLRSFTYTDTNNWFYYASEGTVADSTLDSDGLRHFYNIRTRDVSGAITSWCFNKSLTRQGDLHWNGNVWTDCPLYFRSSETVPNAEGTYTYNYCDSFETGTGQNSSPTDISNNTMSSVVSEFKAYPGEFTGNGSNVPYTSWGPSNLAALGTTTFPTGSTMSYHTDKVLTSAYTYDVTSPVSVYTAAVAAGGSVSDIPVPACAGVNTPADVQAVYSLASTLEDIITRNPGKPCTFFQGTENGYKSLPNNEWWSNSTVGIGSLENEVNNTASPLTPYYSTTALLRVAFEPSSNVAIGNVTFYSCLERASNGTSRNCTPIGTGTYSVQTLGDARVLTLSDPPDLALQLGWTRIFVQRGGNVYFGYQNIAGGSSTYPRLNITAANALFTQLGVPVMVPK
jgi:hypothetical protein